MRGNTYSNGREIRYNILKKIFNHKEKKIGFDNVTEYMEQVDSIR